jgi:low temperature requirement protein LtrA
MRLLRLRTTMSSRDPEEAHRASTPLELFFDLTFVVAIAQAANSLHHGLAEGHAQNVLVGYPLVFFGIWWAWMNFTWFASAYDTDDVLYRLAVLVQIAGVLVYAAGVPRAMEHQDFTVGVLGYVIMRIGLIAQWLRAAHSDPEHRRCCLRYAAGIFVCQLCWIGLLAVPEALFLPGFLVLATAELLVPWWAEHAGVTTWHPRHIAERYGLFTIIVLGESVLAATIAVQTALDADSTLAELGAIAVGALLTVFAMWWIYFDMPAEHVVDRARATMTSYDGGAFQWGYGHYFVFAAAAATGAGIAVQVDQATGHTALTHAQAGLAVTAPVTCYLLAVWLVHVRGKRPGPMRTYACPIAALLLLACSWLPEPVLGTAVVMVGLIAVEFVVERRAEIADGAAG